jgi:hypothetical protein
LEVEVKVIVEVKVGENIREREIALSIIRS